MVTWNKYLVLLLGYLLFSSMLPPKNVKIKHFTKSDYNAASKNWCISSTDDGIIYFANHYGLLEFDGTHWELYNLPNKTIIRGVKVEKDLIYTCGYEELGYWQTNPYGSLEYTSLTDKAMEYFMSKNFEFWNIESQDDTIFFQSYNQILSWHDEVFTPIQIESLIWVMNKVGDKVLAAAHNGIIYQIKNDMAYEYIKSDVLNGKNIKFLLSYNGNQVMIGTDRAGIYLWDGMELNLWKPDWKNYFSKHELNRGLVTKSNQLILGTLSDGVLLFDNDEQSFSINNTSAGLGNNTILGIHTDVWDNIWLALDDGISFIPSKSNENVKIEKLPEIGAVYSTATYNDKMYIATNQGLYLWSREDGNTSIQMVPGTQAQTWYCKKFNDQLWVGHNQGTFIVDGMNAKKISDYSGGFNMVEYGINENRLLQCTYGDLIHFKILPNDSIICENIEGFSDLIQFIEVDYQGNIWASHRYKGVYKLRTNDDRNKIIEEKYYGKNTFGNDNVCHVFKLENQILFTNGTKIFIYDHFRDTILPYDKLNMALGEFKEAQRIKEAPNHHYWFITKNAVGLFQINNEDIFKIQEFPFTVFENCQLVDEFENIEPLTDKTAILCLRNGFAHLDATLEDPIYSMEQFKPTLRKFEIYHGNSSKTILPDKLNIRIKHQYNSLKIRFSFPYISAQPICFQYNLEGLDEHWSERTSDPEYNIERLPKGKYRLKVKAIDSWGNTSMINETKFEVLSPIYTSRLAYILYIVLLVTLLWFFRNRGMKYMQNQVRKQEEMREREAIRLRNEKLVSEVSHKSKELANSTMALIRKNQFLLDLKRIIEKQKSKKAYLQQDRLLNQLNRKIDKNISSEDDWHVFEINFEQAHKQFFEKIKKAYPNLTKSDLKLCAYLRMNLSSKEIAPLMGITIRSVENNRYKLRKKLNLNHDDSLIDVILAI